MSVDWSESSIRVTWFGIVQGSILGPILYVIFISPLFDIENLTCFADDKFPLVYNKNKEVVIELMERKHIPNGKIPLQWLNSSIETFKIKCKKLLLN